MPRIASKKKDYMIKDLKGWIVCQMKVNGLRQEDVAKELGISQSRLSVMLKVPRKGEPPSDPFSYGDLLTLFKLFDVSDEDKQRLLTL